MARFSVSFLAVFMFLAVLSNALPTTHDNGHGDSDNDHVPIPSTPDFLPLQGMQLTDSANQGAQDGLKAAQDAVEQQQARPTPANGPNFQATPEASPVPKPKQQQKPSNNPLQAIPLAGPLVGSLLGGGSLIG